MNSEKFVNFYIKVTLFTKHEEPLVFWGSSAINSCDNEDFPNVKIEFFINHSANHIFQSGYLKVFTLQGLEDISENYKIQVEGGYDKTLNLIFDGFLEKKPFFGKSFEEDFTVLFLTSHNPEFKEMRQIEAASLNDLLSCLEVEFDINFRIPKNLKQNLEEKIRINAFGSLEYFIDYIKSTCGVLVFNSFGKIFSILSVDDKNETPILEISEEDIYDLYILSGKKDNLLGGPFIIDNSFSSCNENEFVQKRNVVGVRVFEEPNFEANIFEKDFHAICEIPFVSILSVWDVIKLNQYSFIIKGIQLYGFTGTEPADIKTHLELLNL